MPPDPNEVLDSFLAANPPMDAPAPRKRGQMPPPPKPRDAWTPPDQGPMKIENLGQGMDSGITVKQPPPQPPSSIDISKTLDATRPAPPKPPEPSMGDQLLEEGVVNPAKQLASGYFRSAAGGAHLLSNAAKGAAKLTGTEPGGAFEDAEKYYSQKADELAGGRRDIPSQIYRGVGQAPGDMAQYTVASTALGPVAGMAAVDAAKEADKGPKAALLAGAKGALTGATFGVMEPASRPVKALGGAALGAGEAAAEGGDTQDIIASGLTMGGMAATGGKREEAPVADQLAQLTAGDRDAVFVAKGQPLPKRPKGTQGLTTPEGTWIYDPKQTNSKDLLARTPERAPDGTSDRNGSDPIRSAAVASDDTAEGSSQGEPVDTQYQLRPKGSSPGEPGPQAPTLQEFRANGEQEPPVAEGYVRLYRGHPAGEKPTKGMGTNWWTSQLELAEQFALDRDEGQHQVSYVDVPEKALNQYSAHDHPEAAKLVGPNEDAYILPRALSARRKALFTYDPEQQVDVAKPNAGTVRLYRGEMIPGTGKPLPDWITERFGGPEAQGRWFTADRDTAREYAWQASDDGRAGTPRVRYIDVPEKDLESYRVSNQRQFAQFSKYPSEEFLLPRELAGKASELPKGMDWQYNLGTPEESAPITADHVSAAFGGRQVQQVGDQFHVPLDNGRTVRVLPDRSIEVDTGAASRAYGRPVGPNEQALGSYSRIDGDGMIQLARDGGGTSALRHETFHAAMDLALTDRERAAVLKQFGSEEAAAEYYSRWVPGTEEPTGTLQKIADYFRNLYRSLRPTAQSVMSQIDAGTVWTRRAEVTERSAVDPNYSLGTYDKWYGTFVKRAKEEGWDDQKIERTLAGAALSRMLYAVRPDLAPVDVLGKSPLRSNTDFGFSLDFDTICSRAQDFYSTVEAIQKQTRKFISGDEWVRLTVLMRDFGENTNCGYCYSAAGRVWSDAKTADLGAGLTQTTNERAATDPAFARHYKAALSYIGGASSGLANKRKRFTPYASQLLAKAAEEIRVFNRNWGVRLQSHTDFKPWHALDMMQFMSDATLKQAAAHVYTKEPWLIRIFGDTNVKINMSMMGEWDPAANKTVYDPVWGLSEDFVKQAAARYPNAGGMAVAMQPEVVIDAMRPENKHIGQIIPMHSSGLTKAQMASYDWTNFTAAHEKPLSAGEMRPGFVRTDAMLEKIPRSLHRDNVEKFLGAAEANGLRPRFAEFIYQLDKNGKIMRGANGNPVRRWTGAGLQNTAELLGVQLTPQNRAQVAAYGKGMEKGYMKLVSDFARTDTPFKPLDSSKVNLHALTQLIQDWHATGRAATDDGVVNPAVVEEFIRRQKEGTLPAPEPRLSQKEAPKPAPLFGLPERDLEGDLIGLESPPRTKTTAPVPAATPGRAPKPANPEKQFPRLPLPAAIDFMHRANAQQASALLPHFARHLARATPAQLQALEPRLDALGVRLGELGVIDQEPRPTPYRKR